MVLTNPVQFKPPTPDGSMDTDTLWLLILNLIVPVSLYFAVTLWICFPSSFNSRFPVKVLWVNSTRCLQKHPTR